MAGAAIVTRPPPPAPSQVAVRQVIWTGSSSRANGRAYDKHTALVDLEARMIAEVRQRLDVVRRPWSGVLYQRNAHTPHLAFNLSSLVSVWSISQRQADAAPGQPDGCCPFHRGARINSAKGRPLSGDCHTGRVAS